MLLPHKVPIGWRRGLYAADAICVRITEVINSRPSDPRFSNYLETVGLFNFGVYQDRNMVIAFSQLEPLGPFLFIRREAENVPSGLMLRLPFVAGAFFEGTGAFGAEAI